MQSFLIADSKCKRPAVLYLWERRNNALLFWHPAYLRVTYLFTLGKRRKQIITELRVEGYNMSKSSAMVRTHAYVKITRAGVDSYGDFLVCENCVTSFKAQLERRPPIRLVQAAFRSPVQQYSRCNITERGRYLRTAGLLFARVHYSSCKWI